eukprot:TRINITY_DN27920_c1_g2_i11.p1 TRINITY_DN27920_c1_g2~~TRINITY_DN27920_c1_g2_i11.p1  ORF type:complete len:333 (-),score=107.18 TRINITY_DN27920_c1_g2_i11:115-1113(-)
MVRFLRLKIDDDGWATIMGDAAGRQGQGARQDEWQGWQAWQGRRQGQGARQDEWQGWQAWQGRKDWREQQHNDKAPPGLEKKCDENMQGLVEQLSRRMAKLEAMVQKKNDEFAITEYAKKVEMLETKLQLLERKDDELKMSWLTEGKTCGPVAGKVPRIEDDLRHGKEMDYMQMEKMVEQKADVNNTETWCTEGKIGASVVDKVPRIEDDLRHEQMMDYMQKHDGGCLRAQDWQDEMFVMMEKLIGANVDEKLERLQTEMDAKMAADFDKMQKDIILKEFMELTDERFEKYKENLTEFTHFIDVADKKFENQDATIQRLSDLLLKALQKMPD